MQRPTLPPPALAPPAPQVIVTIPGSPGATATEIYLGLQAQRKELGNQLENLEDKRRDLSQRLRGADGRWRGSKGTGAADHGDRRSNLRDRQADG